MIEMPTRDQFPADEAGLAGYQKSLLEFSVAMTASGDNQRACEALVTLNPVRYQGLSPKGDAAPATRLVQAIDVSSNNGWDISRLIQANNPEHVVVKLYQSVEKGLASYSVNQANTARSLGKTVGGYVWLYSTIGGATQVQDALRTAEKAAIALPILWLDCEQYTDGSDPNGDTIRQAVAECQRQGVPVGIYTGEWWWDGAAHPLRGDPEFHALPLWYADYSRPPTLDVPDFGGWTMAAGHQYADKPVDRSIFRSDVTE